MYAKLYAKGKDLIKVKTNLGHNKVTSTEIYVPTLERWSGKTETVDINEKEKIAELVQEG